MKTINNLPEVQPTQPLITRGWQYTKTKPHIKWRTNDTMQQRNSNEWRELLADAYVSKTINKPPEDTSPKQVVLKERSGNTKRRVLVSDDDTPEADYDPSMKILFKAKNSGERKMGNTKRRVLVSDDDTPIAHKRTVANKTRTDDKH